MRHERRGVAGLVAKQGFSCLKQTERGLEGGYQLATTVIVQVGIIYSAIGCDVEDNAFEDLDGLLQICKVAWVVKLAEIDGASGDLVLNSLEDTERSFHLTLEWYPVRHTLIHRAGESDLLHAVECRIKLGKAGPACGNTELSSNCFPSWAVMMLYGRW